VKIRNALQNHGQGVCLLLAAIMALILTQQTAAIPIVPAVDGQGYTIRGFTLYGFLHSGQWAQFWNLFCRPNQSICPPHYLLFFILPQALAGTTAYILSQNLVVYFLLVAAIFKLCEALNRKEWAPAIFLLCAVNNLALTDYFYFYLDMEFLSVGLYVVALQLTAWRDKTASPSILSGSALGLLFWIKPANALIFITVFILSEVLWSASHLPSCKTSAARRQSCLASLGHWGFQALGFLPLFALALYCGGGQSILLLIQSNEISDTTSPLNCDAILRLFYFPLCLSFYYHALLLGAILAGVFFIGKIWKPAESPSNLAFASHLFLPVALAYLTWGGFFSFWMQAKAMRSLLPMLPIVWIAFFWLIEKRRLRVELMFLAASIYALTAFSQKYFDLLGTRNSYDDDTYQLNFSSWIQMPSPWRKDNNMNTAISDGIRQHAPPPGVVCVNSIELQKSLAWELNKEDWLLGKHPSHDVHLIFNYKADYFNRTFIGANLIVFKTFGGAQSKSLVYAETLEMIQYGIDQWVTKQHCAQPGMLNANGKDPIGYLFFFSTPLTPAQVDAANKSEPFSKMIQEDNDGSVPVSGHHLSRAEAWELIKAWYDKRTGRTP
jgi:hypothetical protein